MMTELVPLHLLLLAIVFAAVFAAREQSAATRLREELEQLSLNSADPATGMLPQAAIPLRLQPELEWAVMEGKRIGIVVLHVYGGRFASAAQLVRHAMRAHENAFSLGPNRMLIALWDVDDEGVVRAVGRLTRRLRERGHRVVDAGHALGTGVEDTAEALIEAAQRQLRPVDDYLARGDNGERLTVEPLPASASARFARALRRGLPAFAVALGLLVAAHLALPALHERAATAGLAAGAVLAVVVALAAAIGMRAAWNLAWSRASSAGRRLSVPEGALLAGIGTALLLWSVGAVGAGVPGGLLGVVVVYQALLVLPVAVGRVLVRADPVPMLVVAAVAFAGLWLSYESAPLVANLLRITGALMLGLALTRFVDRLLWVGLIAVLIGITDLYSVFFGFTREQFETNGQALDVLLLVGPQVQGQSLFALGTADFVFMAFFMAVAHAWRLGAGRMAIACHLTLVASAVLLGLLPVAGLPVLPLLSAAFLVVAWRPLLDDLDAFIGGLRRDGAGDTRGEGRHADAV